MFVDLFMTCCRLQVNAWSHCSLIIVHRGGNSAPVSGDSSPRLHVCTQPRNMSGGVQNDVQPRLLIYHHACDVLSALPSLHPST